MQKKLGLEKSCWGERRRPLPALTVLVGDAAAAGARAGLWGGPRLPVARLRLLDVQHVAARCVVSLVTSVLVTVLQYKHTNT